MSGVKPPAPTNVLSRGDLVSALRAVRDSYAVGCPQWDLANDLAAELEGTASPAERLDATSGLGPVGTRLAP